MNDDQSEDDQFEDDGSETDYDPQEQEYEALEQEEAYAELTDTELLRQHRTTITFSSLVRLKFRDDDPTEFESTAFDTIKHSRVIVAKDVLSAKQSFVYGAKETILPALLSQIAKEGNPNGTQREADDESRQREDKQSITGMQSTNLSVILTDFWNDTWPTLDILIIEIDKDTEEIHQLLRLVQFVKGYHEYELFQ